MTREGSAREPWHDFRDEWGNQYGFWMTAEGRWHMAYLGRGYHNGFYHDVSARPPYMFAFGEALMANEFTCSTCGKDGTRCDCHRSRPARPYRSEEEARLARIAENDRELARLARELEKLRSR